MQIEAQKLPLQAAASKRCGCLLRKTGTATVYRFGGNEHRIRMVYVSTCYTHTREGPYDERYDVNEPGDEHLAWSTEPFEADIVSMIGGLDA